MAPRFVSPRSPDGRFFARAEGSVIRIHRLPADSPEEQAEGRRWVDADWHDAQARESWQVGDWFAAAFHLNRPLPDRPWDAGPHVHHAYVLARLGRTAEAAAQYLQAVLLDPHLRPWPLDPEAGRRGQRAAQAGDWSRAVADLELAARQPDAPVAAWSDLLLARRVAAPAVAGQSCTELLDRFESNAAASVQLVFSCQDVSCTEADARRFVKVAQRLVASRRNAAMLTGLGAAFYRAGRFEEAARTLQEATKVQGQDGYADTWLFLTLTQQRLGQAAQARTSLASFEQWLKGQKFGTWQETTRWRLGHEEARRLILAMPRADQ